MSLTRAGSALNTEGSGCEPRDQAIAAQFDSVPFLMRQMAKMSIWERMKMVTGLGKMVAFQLRGEHAQDQGRHGPPQSS